MSAAGVWEPWGATGRAMRTHDGWILRVYPTPYPLRRERMAYAVLDGVGAVRFSGTARDAASAMADAEVALYECRRRRGTCAPRSPSLPPAPTPWDSGPRWERAR